MEQTISAARREKSYVMLLSGHMGYFPTMAQRSENGAEECVA
jgi:hypothetical protein